MNQNQSIIDGIVGLVNERRLFDRMPTNEQCRDCVKVALQRVSQSGGTIQHCDFHGPHIGSRYGELRPRLVLVGLENPEPSNCPKLESSACTDTDLESPQVQVKGSLHRKGEFAFIQRIFPSAESPFAHVATLNRRLHGLKSNRKSKSSPLPSCPHAAAVLRLLRPEVIVIEERHASPFAGNGWGTWVPHKVFKEKVGKKIQGAVVMTTNLDGSRVALVLANHPSSLGSRWNVCTKGKYMDAILIPAVREAIRLVFG